MRRSTSLVISIVPWVIAAVLLVIGLTAGLSGQAGDFVSAWFAAGNFAVGCLRLPVS